MHRIEEELNQVKEILRHHPQGMSITDIAAALGKNKHSVGRYMDILHASGHVDLRTFGMAKVYTLSSRVPLSALLSYTTDLVMVVDSGMRVLQVNDPFLTLIGLNRDMVILQEIQFIPAPDPEVHSFLESISRQIHLKEDRDELTLNTQPIRHFHLRIIPTVFDDGTSGTTAILEDISREIAAVGELKQSREFFRDMIANITDGLVVMQGDDILFMNEQMTEITGYSKEEISQLDPVMIASPADRQRVAQSCNMMFENPESLQDIRFWAERKDGTPKYLHVRMSAAPYGAHLRHYMLVTDMTEWKRREEEESLQGTLMRCVIDQLPHPIFCYRHDGVVFMANVPFCSIFGCRDEEDLKGKRIQEILPLGYAEQLITGDAELSPAAGDHAIIQIQIPDPDGSLSLTPVQKTVITTKGGERYIFGVILTECLIEMQVKKPESP